jgi:ATP-dependent DNA helicase RecG
MDLNTSIKELTKVGEATAKKLARLGIVTASDLLWHLPRRYDDFSQQVKIADLKLDDKVNLLGEIQMIGNKRTHRARMNITEALISDETDVLRVVWFNQPFITKTLKIGDKVSLAGKITEDFAGLVMISPSYEKVNAGQILHTQGLVPVYDLTAELSGKQVRFMMGQVLKLAAGIADILPTAIKEKNHLIDLSLALRLIHFPTSLVELEQAKQRIAFEELFLLQLRSQLARMQALSFDALAVAFAEEETKAMVASLPFALTEDQRRSAWEIIQSLASTKPMLRLLEGDVGTGKTVVALLAMLNVAKSGLQSALMAPTEILATQHYETLTRLARSTDLRIALLTRTQYKLNTVSEKLSKAKLIKIIADGEADIVIGTHALIQEKVTFKNLDLVVIDEQHRFGVEQRKALMAKCVAQTMPHLLSMTATPIPRSLALALYDDLDISIIKTKPMGRPPIITKIVEETDRAKAYDYIGAQIKAGRQAFIICPLIDPSDLLGVRSVTEEYERLSQTVFRDFTVGLLHGKLKAKDKDEMMKKFAANEINILVATSVIEVGIDVPNAVIMMIENADRFGLAQLHQYRGRVGRGLVQSYCFLLTDSSDEKARQRLNCLLEFDNGFDLAKADLKFRGPGEVYGRVQSGFPELKIASLFDFELMKRAKEAAAGILAESEDLAKYPDLKNKLGEVEELHLE